MRGGIVLTVFFQEEMVMRIKQKREEMIQSANRYGYTNENTIHYSQELDKLINEYLQKSKVNRSHEVKMVLNQMTMVLQKPFHGCI